MHATILDASCLPPLPSVRRDQLDLSITGFVEDVDDCGFVMIDPVALRRVIADHAALNGISIREATTDIGVLLLLVVLVADRDGLIPEDAAHGQLLNPGDPDDDGRAGFRTEVAGPTTAAARAAARDRLCWSGQLEVRRPMHGGSGVRLHRISPHALRQLVIGEDDEQRRGHGLPLHRTGLRRMRDDISAVARGEHTARLLVQAVLWLATATAGPWALLEATDEQTAELWQCSTSTAKRTRKTLMVDAGIAVAPEKQRRSRKLPATLDERARYVPSAATTLAMLTRRVWNVDDRAAPLHQTPPMAVITTVEGGVTNRESGEVTTTGPLHVPCTSEGLQTSSTSSTQRVRAHEADRGGVNTSTGPTPPATRQPRVSAAVHFLESNIGSVERMLDVITSAGGGATGGEMRQLLRKGLRDLSTTNQQLQLHGTPPANRDAFEQGARCVSRLAALDQADRVWDASGVLRSEASPTWQPLDALRVVTSKLRSHIDSALQAKRTQQAPVDGPPTDGLARHQPAERGATDGPAGPAPWLDLDLGFGPDRRPTAPNLEPATRAANALLAHGLDHPMVSAAVTAVLGGPPPPGDLQTVRDGLVDQLVGNVGLIHAVNREADKLATRRVPTAGPTHADPEDRRHLSHHAATSAATLAPHTVQAATPLDVRRQVDELAAALSVHAGEELR